MLEASVDAQGDVAGFADAVGADAVVGRFCKLIEKEPAECHACDAVNSPTKPLSERQAALLRAVRSYIRSHGYPPSMREIAATLGYSSVGSVWYQLQELEAAGYIRKSERRPRAFEIVEYAEEEQADEPGSDGLVWVPKLDDQGKVERSEGHVLPLPRQLVGEGSHFVLPVTDDSMSGAAIRSGDWVVVREQQTAEEGEIVAAIHQGKPTIAVVQRRGDEVWLVPRNGHFSPVRDDDAKILGSVVAVLRRV